MKPTNKIGRMIRTLQNIIIFVYILFCLAVFALVLAPHVEAISYTLDIPCKGGLGDECDLYDFVQLGRNIINFLIAIAVPAFAIGAAYAGYLLLTSGGNPSARDRAKDIMWKMVIGFIFMLSAWLIVYAITAPLLNEGYSLLKTK